jgi:integrase
VADNRPSKALSEAISARRIRELSQKTGMDLPDDISNLATPTHRNGLFSNEKPFFFNSKTTMADTIGRKPLKSRSGFLYRKARLVAPSDYNLQKDWFIIFYTTDSFNEKLIRKRVLKDELGSLLTIDDRLKYAEQAISEINQLLYNDWHTESTQPPPSIVKFDFRHYTMLKAFDYVAGIKRDIDGVKKKTVQEYLSTKTTMEDFFQHEGISRDFLVRNVNDTFVRKYFDYLKQVRGVANKTYNCRRTMLHALFNTLIDRDKKLFSGVNPIAKVDFLKTESKKHAAYTDEQMIRIRDIIIKGNEPYLLLFIQFMFFTLARPDEIRFLKIGDIKFSDKKILFQSQDAKTSIDEFVGINDSFARVIEQSGILNFPENYFVFSVSNGKNEPGNAPVGKNYFYKHIKPYVNALGLTKLNPNYTIYSFKHTGAISLYKATKDIKLVQAQCRHKNIEQTNIYLRDLGVLSNFDLLNQWKSPI